MEEKLQTILENYSEQLARHESDLEKLEARMQFCSEHNLQEELRITHVKHEAANLAIYRWGKMFKEIQEVLNAWNS